MTATNGVQRGRTSPRRAGFSYRGLLVALAVVAAVPALAWSLIPEFPWSSKTAGPLLYTVERKDYIHQVTERGTVASASNVEVRCQVKSRGSSGIQILYVVPEGTYVTPAPDWKPADPDNPGEPPDLLVKLDSSALESQLTQQQIVCANSEAAKIQAQNVFDTAEITKEEYIEGTYKEKKQGLEADIKVAEENQARAREYLSYSELLYSKGYISDRELQANKFDVEKKQLELDKAQTAMDVLENYTKKKTVNQLDADIKTAQAKLDAANYSYKLDQEELEEVKTQIANCTIRAPQPGQVVYANITDRRGGSEVIIEEGAQVRERQVLIKLPDPKRMQVEAKVNEAKVALVRPGLAANIRLDAFAGMELKGTVEKISKYPAPSSFFTANVKEYDAVIRIDGLLNSEDPEEEEEEGEDGQGGSLSNLRSGMTAEVKIRVEQIPQVLQVPVQAVFQHGSQCYCVVPDGEGFRAKEVKIGSTNDKVVVIQEGLEEGQKVVLNSASYRDKIDLPEVPAEEVAQVDAKAVPAAAAEKGEGAAPPAAAAAPGGERGTGGERSPGERVDMMLSRFDSNGNGQLELTELPEQLRSNLAAADTNGDGAIDRAELTAGIARMPARGGPGRSGFGGPGGPREGGRGGDREGRPGENRGGESGGPGGRGPGSRRPGGGRPEGGTPANGPGARP